jgi:hypothetical protein
MSLSLVSTKILTGALLAIGIGGTGAAFALSPTVQKDVQAVQSALSSKDFGAFKSATIQAATDRVNSMTQDQFDKLSTNYTQHKAAQDAIAAGDYIAFQNSGDTRMLKRITTEEQFRTAVSEYTTRKAAQASVNETIKNNDFAAYKTAISQLMNARKQDSGDTNGPSRPQPTDAQLQTRFDTLVANYKADGSLPTEDGFGRFGMMGMGRGHGGGMRGDHAMEGPQDIETSDDTAAK